MRIPPLVFEALGNIYRRQSQGFFPDSRLTYLFKVGHNTFYCCNCRIPSSIFESLKSSFFLTVSAVDYFIAGALSHSDHFNELAGRALCFGSQLLRAGKLGTLKLNPGRLAEDARIEGTRLVRGPADTATSTAGWCCDQSCRDSNL